MNQSDSLYTAAWAID